MIGGVPQTLAHDPKLDILHGYAKAVTVGADDHFKLFTTGCGKLPYNQNNEQRQHECRLASGYFIVSKLGLFTKLPSRYFEDFGVELEE